MAIKHPRQRVGVLIDAQNMYHSAKHLYGAKVHFGKIVELAVAGRQLIRAIAYVVTTEAGEEAPFLEALERSGIEIRSKELQIFPGGAKKGDWDIGMAMDAIRLGAKLDAVILVTGDGDFVPLVEFLKASTGAQVEVVAFEESASGKLMAAADHFVDLSDPENKKSILIRGTRRERSEA